MASIARDWIRYSQALRQAGVCDATKLEGYDKAMQQMLGRVSARVRASAFNAAFDAAVAKRGQPFNRIKDGAKISSVAELQSSKDADLLIVGTGLFGYDLQIYQELDSLLGTCNDSAHPGMAQPGVLDVQQFANKVNSYVFQTVKI